MKTKAFSRDERRSMIVTWFAIRIQKGNEDYATMNTIARGIGMTPSTHLTQILKDMCADRVLHSLPHEKNGRWTGSKYMLYPNTYKRPQARQINLRVNGRDEGQLSLWQ